MTCTCDTLKTKQTTLPYKYLPFYLPGKHANACLPTHAYNHTPCTGYSYFTMCLIALYWHLKDFLYFFKLQRRL